MSGFCKRIIPCLDVKDGRVVKGVQFVDIRDAGDPVELAVRYARAGADELVLLDITATVERRSTLTALVKRVAQAVDIPFTVGGGIASASDVAMVLEAGADKISVNSAAFRHPTLIETLSARFGSQCIVVAIDTRKEADGQWYVYLDGGRTPTGRLALEWADAAAKQGAGEILLTAMNNDGQQQGFALDMTAQIATRVPIPVIASGGAGSMQHFAEVFKQGLADAALAASIFHFGTIDLSDLKEYLLQQQIAIRL